MKKFLALITLVTFIVVLSGCATWNGVKKDTSDAYDATKEAIHDATK
ncbi:entericidin EcnAB [Arcobacter sp. F2176]|nr:entericidin EcnAB [Arcobacter sp. F2176]RXJ82626.1 entericidin EcnAB [Arcobacter sp. F2176]